MYLTRGPLNLCNLVQLFAQLRAQQVHIHIRLHQQMPHATTLLVQQGDHQVGRLDKLVVTTHREALGICQGLLKLACHFVHSHKNALRMSEVYTCICGVYSVVFQVFGHWNRTCARSMHL
jgi:hypothetical protein